MKFNLGYFHVVVKGSGKEPAIGFLIGFRKAPVPLFGEVECFGIWIYLVSFCFHFGIDYLVRR